MFNEKYFRHYTVDRILIGSDSPIKTEAQFCLYIYRRFGVGRYLCLAFQKGREGFWNYWNGDIMDNGFVRSPGRFKEIQKQKQESYKENEEGTMYELTESKDSDKKGKRRGPTNLIKLRPGILYPYEEI